MPHSSTPSIIDLVTTALIAVRKTRLIPLLIANPLKFTILKMNLNYTKPSGLTPEYGAQFQDKAIVKAYRHREPYPNETFDILRELAESPAPVIADIGCGPGDLSFGLGKFASKLDAVDISREMISEAKRSAPEVKNINWICSPAESAPLEGPYDLITAADSIHWMDWRTLFLNIRKWLKPGKFLCVVGRWYEDRYWWDEKFQSVITAYSTNREFKKYDIVEELKKSGYVTIVGTRKTKPVGFTQSVDDLIEAFHSRNGLSRDRMGASAELFDREVKALLCRFTTSGNIQLSSAAHVTWMTIN